MKKRLRSIFSLMVISTTLSLSLSLSSSAQVPETMKINARGVGQAGFLSARATGYAVYAASNLHRVGGVMFQGELENGAMFNDVVNLAIKKQGDMARVNMTFKKGNTTNIIIFN